MVSHGGVGFADLPWAKGFLPRLGREGARQTCFCRELRGRSMAPAWDPAARKWYQVDDGEKGQGFDRENPWRFRMPLTALAFVSAEEKRAGTDGEK